MLDTTYGDGGVARLQTGTADPGETPGSNGYGLAVQDDGSALIVGLSGSPTYTEMVVVRFTPDGAPDPAFGTGGVVRFQPSTIAEPETFGFGISVAPDGNTAVAVGQMRQAVNGRGVVARILLKEPAASTTTTTLPDPCAPPGSLTNALCGFDALTASLGVNVPPGSLRDRFVGLVGKGRAAAQATEGQSGKARRKSFKRALGALKKLQKQLKSKRARRAIAEAPRSDMATQASQIAAVLSALRDAG
jgi:hypothetical protein